MKRFQSDITAFLAGQQNRKLV